MGADDTGNHEGESEESEAVQGCDGALRFAKAHGFQEESLLTEKSRKAWLIWKESLRDPKGRGNWGPGLNAPDSATRETPEAWLRERLDARYGYEFFVNPLGVQMDLTQDDVVGNEDDSWDAIWDSAGRIGDQGFTVEIAIPLSQLRFARTTGDRVWGLDVLRFYPRSTRHRISNNALERGRNCYMCQFQKFSGLAGVESYLRIAGQRAEQIQTQPVDPRVQLTEARLIGERLQSQRLLAACAQTEMLFLLNEHEPDTFVAAADNARRLNYAMRVRFPATTAAGVYDSVTHSCDDLSRAIYRWALQESADELDHASLVVALEYFALSLGATGHLEAGAQLHGFALPRLPALPWTGIAGKEEQRRFGDASSIELADASGTVLASQKGLFQGYAGLAAISPLAPGDYVVRVRFPGDPAREERATVTTGQTTRVAIRPK